LRFIIGVEGRGDAAAGELLGGLALPGLSLAADGFEAGWRVLLEETPVGVTGADRLELVGIAERAESPSGGHPPQRPSLPDQLPSTERPAVDHRTIPRSAASSLGKGIVHNK
jgi:hypothetical protein